MAKSSKLPKPIGPAVRLTLSLCVLWFLALSGVTHSSAVADEHRQELKALQEQAASLHEQMQEVKKRLDEARKDKMRTLLGEEADDENLQVIRLSTTCQECVIKTITDAYEKTHPKVRFRLYTYTLNLDDFSKGRLDLMAYTLDLPAHFGGDDKEKFNKAFPKPPKSIVFAYEPKAVIVHPRNSLTKISCDQIKLLVEQRDKTWKDLGRDTDGPIRLYTHDPYFLYDGWKQLGLPTRPERNYLNGYRSFAFTEKEKKPWWEKPATSLSKDPDCLGVYDPDRSFVASGLKILQLVPQDGGPPLSYDDKAAVVSGRYWLRTSLRMTIHPQAKPAAKQFFEWLQTPEAAKAIVEAHRASNAADIPFVPASLPQNTPPATSPATDSASEVAFPLPSGPAPRANIDGAVAVLPFMSVSRYFLMANISHRDLYENRLFESIERDERLTMVDRVQLQQAIAEQKISMFSSGESPKHAIIAADVFVVPRIITRADKAYLQIEAVHGASATSLGMMETPIDPVDPTRFDPPLDKQISTWWPWVLDTLQRVRTRPRWYVHDVDCEQFDQVVESDAILRHLHRTLQQDRRIAPANGSAMTLTQQERLMHLMGMSKDRAGSFVPMYDYMVEGRFQPDGALHITLRDAWYKKLAEKDFDRALTPTARLDAVRSWLDGQIASHPGRVLSDDASPEVLQRWIHLQSRLEYNYSHNLVIAYVDFRQALEKRDSEDEQSRENLPLILADRQRNDYTGRYEQCLLAAKTLDPDASTPPEARIASVDKTLARKLKKKKGEPYCTSLGCYAVPDKRFLSKELARELVDAWLRRATDSAIKYHEAETLCKKLRAEGLDTNGFYSVRQGQTETLDLVAGRYWRHAQRVVQLDPMWEQGAKPLVMDTDIRNNDSTYDALLDAKCFFLSRFPDSKYCEELFYILTSNSSSSDDAILRRTPEKYHQMSIDTYMEFCKRYVIPNKIRSGYMPGECRFQHYGHLLYRINGYFKAAGATPENERWVLTLWHDRLGENTRKDVLHSDFVRLAVAAHRPDRAEFFKILHSLQQRWPDPKVFPWKYHVDDGENSSDYKITGLFLADLLQPISYETQTRYDDHFRSWLDGKIATKDLWWTAPDFKPAPRRLSIE